MRSYRRCADTKGGRGEYHGQVFEDLDPVSWAHVSHVVEVGGVGDQLVPHLWVSQHLSGTTKR